MLRLAVLRQSSLSLDECPWLAFQREELQLLLLQLPLARLMVDKRPVEGEDRPDPPWDELPDPLWDEELL